MEEMIVEEEKGGIKFIATVTGLKGDCHAHHRLGETIELIVMSRVGSVVFFIMIFFLTSMPCNLAGNIHGGIRI